MFELDVFSLCQRLISGGHSDDARIVDEDVIVCLGINQKSEALGRLKEFPPTDRHFTPTLSQILRTRGFFVLT